MVRDEAVGEGRAPAGRMPNVRQEIVEVLTESFSSIVLITEFFTGTREKRGH
jgi:hypothetical protein